MKKWVIVGFVVAVLTLVVGAAMCVSLWRTSVEPDVVKSLTDLPRNGRIWHAAWSPDGQRILYESGGIFTVGADGTDLVYLGEGDDPVWSPDGSRIAFATDNGLQVMSADGGERRPLVDLAEVVLPLSRDKRINSTAWSPDGSMIAFEAWGFVPDPSDASGHTGASIQGTWIVDADGGGLRQLAADSEAVRNLVWSPDSQRIAFHSNTDEGRAEIWTSRVDGTDLRQLTSSDEYEFDMSWSPDGSKIAFASGYSLEKEERPDIWVMDADGSNKVQLTDGPESYEKPAWSPDGSMVAFSSTRQGPVGDIWVMNADGSVRTKLTRTSRFSFTCNPKYICYEDPRWSPDGTKLLFLNRLTEWEGWGSSTSGYDRVWVLELDLEKSLN